MRLKSLVLAAMVALPVPAFAATDIFIFPGTGGEDTLEANLASGDVTLDTTSGGSNAGNIEIYADIDWLSSNTLTMVADNYVYWDFADLNAPSGSVDITAGGEVYFDSSDITVGGSFSSNSAGLGTYFYSMTLAYLDTSMFSVVGDLILSSVTLDLSSLTTVPTTLISMDAGTVSGTFLGLGEGSIIDLLGGSYFISYMGGDGNDITLTRTDVPAVPLPASAWLLVAGLAGLAAGTRRKAAT